MHKQWCSYRSTGWCTCDIFVIGVYDGASIVVATDIVTKALDDGPIEISQLQIDLAEMLDHAGIPTAIAELQTPQFEQLLADEVLPAVRVPGIDGWSIVGHYLHADLPTAESIRPDEEPRAPA